MVSKKLPYDTNGLPYDVYMGDSRPQCKKTLKKGQNGLRKSMSKKIMIGNHNNKRKELTHIYQKQNKKQH